VSLATLLSGAGYSDADVGALQGVAIVGADGPGTWQFSVNGGSTWSALGNVSEAQALLLNTSAKLRFMPGLHQTGQATLVYRAWDQTAGISGSLYTVTGTGGALSLSSIEATVTLAINHVNHAPTWSAGSPTFTPILPGTANPAGDSVASLFGSFFNDIDGDSVGVAVTGLTGTTSGLWQYSLNGVSWNSFGSVSLSAARLLTGSDLIRFVPNVGFAGQVTLTAYGWDQTTGSNGGTSSVVPNGGTTAFSKTTLIASLRVNNAPTIANTAPTLPSTVENTTSAAVRVTALLTLAGAHDADAGALTGVALVGASGPGTWQFSLNGSTWKNVGSVSEASALLLASTASVRFIPGLNQTGTATLIYRAWDQTQGTSGNLYSVAGTGGATSISSAEATATMTVTPGTYLNIAPTWTSLATSFTSVLPGSTPAGDTVASLFGSLFYDPNNDPVGVAVTGLSNTTNGTWEYSLNGGGTWLNFGAVSVSAALLLTGSDLIRFVPNPGFAGAVKLKAFAWDQTSGVVGSVVNLYTAGLGGTTPYSTAAIATCIVNTAPSLI
jgi:hypothetical protein